MDTINENFVSRPMEQPAGMSTENVPEASVPMPTPVPASPMKPVGRAPPPVEQTYIHVYIIHV